MNFSERMGINLRQEIQIDDLDKRTRNLLYNVISRYTPISHNINYISEKLTIGIAFLLGEKIAPNFCYYPDVIDKICSNSPWHTIYDIMELVYTNLPSYDDDKKNEYKMLVNSILEQEKCNYRMGNDGLFIKVGSEEEFDNIEQTLSLAKDSAKEHFQTALVEYSKRGQDINYASVCNEAIKAVEALTHQFLDDKYKNATLGQCLEPFRQKLNTPSFIIEPIKRIWESSNHGEKATRHEGGSVIEPEAYYILIICSAFMNYVYKTSGKFSD